MQKQLCWLENKVIFITWWTSGMWKATVLKAVANGAKVAFIGRREAEWAQVVHEAQTIIAENQLNSDLTDAIFFQACDVTDFPALEKAVQNILTKRWRIDGLFCCAGTHLVGDILSTSLEERNDLFKLNLTSMFMTLKYVLPTMMQQNAGRVVLMWSDQSFIGKPQSSAYGATKAAIGQLTKSTAIDYAKYSIGINAVCPWTIDTPQAARAADAFAKEKFGWNITQARDAFKQSQPIKRLWAPDEVANLVCYLLSEQSSYMTGALVSIDGGYVAG